MEDSRENKKVLRTLFYFAFDLNEVEGKKLALQITPDCDESSEDRSRETVELFFVNLYYNTTGNKQANKKIFCDILYSFGIR